MKLTREQIINKSNLVNSILTKEELESTSQSKFKYAVQRSNQKVESALKKYNQEVESVNVNLASEDKDGNLIVSEQGRYSYSKENELKKRAKLIELLQVEEEFEPFLFTDQEKINTFDPFLREELAGFFFASE